MTTPTISWRWLATPTRTHLFMVCSGPPSHLVLTAIGRVTTLCGVGVDTKTGLSRISGQSPPTCKLCLQRWEREVIQADQPTPADARAFMERPFEETRR